MFGCFTANDYKTPMTPSKEKRRRSASSRVPFSRLRRLPHVLALLAWLMWLVVVYKGVAIIAKSCLSIGWCPFIGWATAQPRSSHGPNIYSIFWSCWLKKKKNKQTNPDEHTGTLPPLTTTPSPLHLALGERRRFAVENCRSCEITHLRTNNQAKEIWKEDGLN